MFKLTIGSRTRLTFPDTGANALYISYVYDVLNRVTSIGENGATSGVGLLASYGYDGGSRLQSLIQSLAGTAAVPDPDELVVTGPARDTIQPPAKDFGALSGSFSGPSSRSASNGEANSTGGFPGNRPSRHSAPPPPKGKPSYLCRVGTTAQSAASGLGRAAFASVLAGSIPNPLSLELLFLGAGFGTAASAIDALGFVLEHATC